MPLISYDLPEELHRRIELAAATRNQSLQAFVVDALESALAHQERETRDEHGG